MRYVFEKMSYQVPGGFKCFDILLSANMAIPAMHRCITIQAIFLGAFI